MPYGKNMPALSLVGKVPAAKIIPKMAKKKRSRRIFVLGEYLLWDSSGHSTFQHRDFVISPFERV